MSVRIAVVQQETIPGAVEANRAKALSFTREALAGGADIVLFHEELLVGYVANLRDLAEPLDGPTTQAFQALLAGRDSLILYGLTERDGEDCYIAAPVVSANGVIANYRKTHLWWKAKGPRHEPTFYKPGDALVTFDLKGHKCGVMICYDGDFPEMTRTYADLGCEMLFWLNNREARGHEEVRPLSRANSIIIAASCCCGRDEEGRQCEGASNITDMDAALLAEIRGREGVIFADVHPERTAAHRADNPWYIGRRPELYR